MSDPTKAPGWTPVVYREDFIQEMPVMVRLPSGNLVEIGQMVFRPYFDITFAPPAEDARPATGGVGDEP